MTLNEAIEELQAELETMEEGELTKWVNALQLGILALKRIRQLRVIELNPEAHHLPGETRYIF